MYLCCCSLLPDIIGKSGACIRAIQDYTHTRMNVPQTKEDASKVKIKIAGKRDDIAQAKSIIKDIIQYRHHAVTHPGVVHTELENIPERMFNLIIGSKGSEIRHIQNNFKVSVHMPSSEPDAVAKNILVVGNASGVESAKKYILKIVDQAATQESDTAATASAWKDDAKAAGGGDGDGDGDAPNEWTQQYMYNRSSAGGTLADAAVKVVDAQATAWNNASEGW
jgi:rRNA processing protein Krr1/Pno1